MALSPVELDFEESEELDEPDVDASDFVELELESEELDESLDVDAVVSVLSDFVADLDPPERLSFL